MLLFMCIAASSGEERLCAAEQCEVVRQLVKVKTWYQYSCK